MRDRIDNIYITQRQKRVQLAAQRIEISGLDFKYFTAGICVRNKTGKFLFMVCNVRRIIVFQDSVDCFFRECADSGVLYVLEDNAVAGFFKAQVFHNEPLWYVVFC